MYGCELGTVLVGDWMSLLLLWYQLWLVGWCCTGDLMGEGLSSWLYMFGCLGTSGLLLLLICKETGLPLRCGIMLVFACGMLFCGWYRCCLDGCWYCTPPGPDICSASNCLVWLGSLKSLVCAPVDSLLRGLRYSTLLALGALILLGKGGFVPAAVPFWPVLEAVDLGVIALPIKVYWDYNWFSWYHAGPDRKSVV